MKQLLKQLLKFSVVGGTAFLIDYGIMVLLTEVVQIDYLISSAISFSISVIYNYLLSVFWVFDVNRSETEHGKSFIIFLVLSLIGLGLNQLLMWLGSDILSIHYMITKIGATAIVMVYNFITRKLFLEQSKEAVS